MEIYFRSCNGGDFVRIDGMTLIRQCVVRDTCGERCDSLEAEFENAEGWYQWAPQEDDEIIVRMGNYDTGILYLNTILPEDGKYRILATSLPCRARTKEYKSYTGWTIEAIMRSCAARSRMSYQIFGIDGHTVIPYIEQENESAAAFLQKMLALEDASLKCVNGNYTAIGYQYAQDMDARRTIAISAQQRGTQYRRIGKKVKTMTVKTPYAQACAEDLMVDEGQGSVLVCDIPAVNDIQAGRWARSLIRHHNMQCESLTVYSDFDPAMTAMTRIDVSGGTDADGEWIVVDVEHDLKREATKAKMLRCVCAIQ